MQLTDKSCTCIKLYGFANILHNLGFEFIQKYISIPQDYSLHVLFLKLLLLFT